MKRSSLTPSPSVTKRCRSSEIYNPDQARNFIIDSDDELDFDADYPDSELEEEPRDRGAVGSGAQGSKG
ncbi:hypothetical protein ElyMa_003538000 [Elysia marginata]|uniref:Uncharacterized protein n=1 Tax=Elysia marginata TaxID=1093978 RepID=A0AAV4EKA4_9GAST|nr:hypothetical protein ElyMa_003538000 [Elysia marginata]